ncbi:hypothetical protein OG900_19455 [Streptomyces sp. NBC_00433]
MTVWDGAGAAPSPYPYVTTGVPPKMSDLVFIAVTIAVFAVLALVAKGVGRL